MDLKAVDTKIAAEVSSNNMMTNVSPLFRRVKTLIEVAIESEGGSSDRTVELQVIKALFEARYARKFAVSSNHDRQR